MRQAHRGAAGVGARDRRADLRMSGASIVHREDRVVSQFRPDWQSVRALQRATVVALPAHAVALWQEQQGLQSHDLPQSARVLHQTGRSPRPARRGVRRILPDAECWALSEAFHFRCLFERQSFRVDHQPTLSALSPPRLSVRRRIHARSTQAFFRTLPRTRSTQFRHCPQLGAKHPKQRPQRGIRPPRG